MSSTSSQELAALALASNGPECEPSRSARSIHSADESSRSTGRTSHAIPTLEQRTLPIRSMSFVEGSLASPLVQHREDGGLPSISGPRCSELSKTFGPALSSPKTSRKRRSPTRLETSMDLAIERTAAVYLGLTQGRTIREIVGGSLHTPTRKANFTAPSMQKWPSCRNFVAAFGGREITPEQFEFLMGLPIGWTELAPSET